MRVDVSLVPAEIGANDASHAVVIVIDVLRATSTIAAALANGCDELIPTESIEEAINIASGYRRSDYVLGGERRGVAVDGFDLGNSPGEYVASIVGGKKVILTTTNGTCAIKKYGNSVAIYTACFLNADAVLSTVASEHGDNDVILVCAGQEDRFCMEDALCAGLLARRFEEELGASLSDSARAVAMLYHNCHDSIQSELLRSSHGAYLSSIGYEQDVLFCSGQSTIDVVPKVYDRRVIRRARLEPEE